jgi:hypothetical protein
MRHLKCLALLLLAACGGSEVGGGELAGAPERGEYAPLGPDGSATLAEETKLEMRVDGNLRETPDAQARVIMVVPEGATVTVVESTEPRDGYYRVDYFGRTGWVYGGHMALSVGTVSSGLTDAQKDNILERARRSTGYSYWWGGARFGCDLGKGDCIGSGCPGDCRHVGEGGADCSGMVAKAWAVPPSAPGTCENDHPYSTETFAYGSNYWFTISRADIEPADAFVRRTSGHIMIRAVGSSASGLPDILECSGCAAGCIHHYRSVSSDEYKVIRRDANL